MKLTTAILSLFLCLNASTQASFAGAAEPLSAEIKSHSTVLIEREEFSPKRKGYCTGTLIKPHVVLTAAHCLTAPLSFPAEQVKAKYRILFGEAPLIEKSPMFVEVQSELMHPKFTGIGPDGADYIKNINDIALLFLDPSDELPEEIVPMALFYADVSKLDKKTPIFSAGYGPAKSFETRAEFVKLVTLHFSEGRLMGAYARTGQMRQTNKGRPGDSGGPTYILVNGEFHLIGVNSSVGSFEPISRYLNWINDSITLAGVRTR